MRESPGVELPILGVLAVLKALESVSDGHPYAGKGIVEEVLAIGGFGQSFGAFESGFGLGSATGGASAGASLRRERGTGHAGRMRCKKERGNCDCEGMRRITKAERRLIVEVLGMLGAMEAAPVKEIPAGARERLRAAVERVRERKTPPGLAPGRG